MKISVDSPLHFAEIDKYHYDRERSFVIRSLCDGWVGSGFNREYASMQVHKCSDGTVSIGVGVEQYKGENDRHYEMTGALVLSADLVEALIKELQK